MAPASSCFGVDELEQRCQARVTVAATSLLDLFLKIGLDKRTTKITIADNNKVTAYHHRSSRGIMKRSSTINENTTRVCKRLNKNKYLSAMSQQQLPAEMEEEILCRLPVKSLARFRCVSKPWRSLINKHCFARKHLTFAARPDNLSQKRMILYSPREQNLMNKYIKDYRVVASCDGLLCVAVDFRWLYLGNPSLDIWRWVPDPIEPQQRSYHDCRANFTFSLGYDSATDDYKLIKFSRHLTEIKGIRECETRVFSLKSWSWRKLEDFAPLKHCWECVFVDGSIYWLVRNVPYLPTMQVQVFSYNLSEDKYRGVALPERYPLLSPFKRADHVRLFVLKGMLCVVALWEHCLVLWAMKNRDIGNWTKILDIPFQQVFDSKEFLIYQVFFMYEDGEVLMGVASRRKTELLVCKENRVLSRQIVFNEPCIVEYGFVLVETLLSPLHA